MCHTVQYLHKITLSISLIFCSVELYTFVLTKNKNSITFASFRESNQETSNQFHWNETKMCLSIVISSRLALSICLLQSSCQKPTDNNNNSKQTKTKPDCNQSCVVLRNQPFCLNVFFNCVSTSRGPCICCTTISVSSTVPYRLLYLFLPLGGEREDTCSTDQIPNSNRSKKYQNMSM